MDVSTICLSKMGEHTNVTPYAASASASASSRPHCQILGTYTNLGAAEIEASACLQTNETQWACNKLYTSYSQVFLNAGVQELGALVVMTVSSAGDIQRVRLYKTANSRALRSDAESCKVDRKLWCVLESRVAYLDNDRRETTIRGTFTNFENAKKYASKHLLDAKGLNEDSFSYYKQYDVDEDAEGKELIVVEGLDNTGTHYLVSILCNVHK
ncbi:hypothetical protein BX600DRAFT_101638 [Xylariales sp. PMI_506]|nr:hypothetical protein BX600DRAFT_101638 [Xylariales sp. PMI_506]